MTEKKDSKCLCVRLYKSPRFSRLCHPRTTEISAEDLSHLGAYAFHRLALFWHVFEEYRPEDLVRLAFRMALSRPFVKPFVLKLPSVSPFPAPLPRAKKHLYIAFTEDELVAYAQSHTDQRETYQPLESVLPNLCMLLVPTIQRALHPRFT